MIFIPLPDSIIFPCEKTRLPLTNVCNILDFTLTDVGIGDKSYEDVQKMQSAVTGGISASFTLIPDDNQSTHSLGLKITSKSLEDNEKKNFMELMNIEKTGLNYLIEKGYKLLELETFFTSGPEESRAWTVKKDSTAPVAAGKIHSDFEKNFIRAEAVSCEDFIKYGSSEKCKENGKLRIEGKEYVVRDGDVLYFRVNP